jgi:hypothetical protein
MPYVASRVAVAGSADLEPLISVMVLAFAADPVARWMYHDPQRYLAYFGRFITAFAGKAFSIETAWCIGGNLGAALWLPPGVKPDQEAILGILDESVPRDVMADVNAMFGEMAAYHPRDPHWYLPTIGVDRIFTAGASARRCWRKRSAGATSSTCRPIWNPATPPTPRCTRGSASRRLASYAWAARRPCSRCCGLHANPLVLGAPILVFRA